MARRLFELFPVGTAVEILLNDTWWSGVVVHHDHPAVWVETADGRAWFVTNRQRIRRLTNSAEGSPPGES